MTEEYKKLMEHVEEVAKRENCFLYDIEMPGSGPGRALRVFIDKEGEEGVSIDDCSRVSQGLNLVLDVEDLVPGGAYNLEVSSPGLERKLTQAWHFEKAVGQTVNLQLNRGLGEFVKARTAKDEKRKKITAIIKQAGETEVSVSLGDTESEDEVFAIPLQYIHKAKIVYAFENNFSSKKPKGRKG